MIKDERKIASFYKALVNRDSTFIGAFFACVKTTSIFCISTCRARKPKFENVEFCSSFKEALDFGYRPCKICKPTRYAFQAPDEFAKAIDMVKQSPKSKITDYMLRQNEINPVALRRWFQKHYQMTFHAYQRMYRVNQAYIEIKAGNSSSNAAYNSGYESLSGFAYTCKKLVGDSPRNLEKQKLVNISRTTTPLGPMFICATDKGICLVEFVDRKMLETEFKDLQRLLKARIIYGENEFIRQAKNELNEYFAGKLTDFEVPLDLPGTEFQKNVWNMLTKIPYGKTSTYSEQASFINKPNAIRAMGRANGCNRVSIIVPCHRVVAKDGGLRGYGGGIERKQWLLNHEGQKI